jgi:hypothetical protein
VTPAQLRAARAAAQGLHPAVGGRPEDVVARLLAVQAQDFHTARLAIRARAPGGPLAADVDAALTTERSLVIAWLMRGTLHIVGREEHAWLLALTAPGREAAARRRLDQLGLTPAATDRAVAVVGAALAADGPLSRAELRERLAARGLPTAGQATPHLLAAAVRRGVALLGPVRDGEPAFALTRDWLGAPPPPRDRDTMLAELARRWLAGHGPATAADLAAWAGLPLRDARAGLRAIGGKLADLGGGLVDLAARGASGPLGRELAGPGGPVDLAAPGAGDGSARPSSPAGRAPARLLPAFDPFMLGWRDRGFAVDHAHARRVHPGGGIVRATATVGGRVVGTWSARRQRGRLTVAVEPFAPLSERTARALAADAGDVARFEGLAPG